MDNFCIALSFSNNEIAKISNRQPCNPQFSNSPVQSIAAFILRIFPHLSPPNISQDQDAKTKTVAQPNESYYHPFFQAWADYVNQCILDSRAIYYENTLYCELPIPIDRQRLSASLIGCTYSKFELQDLNEFSFQEPKDRLLKIFDLPPIQLKKKKVGLFIYEKGQDRFTLKVNSLGLFMGNLYNNEKWQVLTITDGQPPSVQKLITFDGIVLPGSNLSVFDLKPQLARTIKNIVDAHKINPKMKILGVCFGHQLISHFFGAKLEKKGRKGGLEIINFNRPIIQAYPFFSPLLNLDYIRMSEHHEDYVQEVPAGFKLVANSKSCKVECLLSEDARILTTQFHSEFFCKFTQGYQKRSLHYNNYNPLPSFYVQESAELESQNIDHSRIFLGVIRKYFQGLN